MVPNPPLQHTIEQYFLEKTGHAGLNNIISAYPDKSAYAQCIFAYTAGKGQEVITFVGRTEGKGTTFRLIFLLDSARPTTHIWINKLCIRNISILVLTSLTDAVWNQGP
jgi:hypothetical protein